MKIKIRPDDVGTPGGNEWAEMNGWLAELREDSPEGPVDDRAEQARWMTAREARWTDRQQAQWMTARQAGWQPSRQAR